MKTLCRECAAKEGRLLCSNFPTCNGCQTCGKRGYEATREYGSGPDPKWTLLGIGIVVTALTVMIILVK